MSNDVRDHPDLPRGAYDPASYWNDRLARHDGFAAVGDRTLGEAYNRWMYRVREVQVRRAVAWTGLTLPDARILELAPGIGFYIGLWDRLGVRQVTALDISAAAVDRLRERYPRYRFVRGDAGACPAAVDGTYDLVTAIDVLYHISEDSAWERALVNVAGWVRPGGYFLFTDSLPPEEKRVAGPHVVKRGRAVYLDRLARLGFSQVAVWPFAVLMQAPDATSVANRRAAMWVWDRLHALFYHTWGLGIHEAVGEVLGAAGFIVDRVLGSIVREGPSIRLWLFKRDPSVAR